MSIADLNTELDARESGWKPFPTDALPGPVADLVRATAKSLNVAESQVGALTLPVLAAAIGNAVRLKMNDEWFVPSILWVGLVADSGSKKSPVLRRVLNPVNRLEKAAYEAYAATDDDEARTRYKVGDVTVEALGARMEANPRGLLMVRDELAGWLGSFDKYNRGKSDTQSWIEIEGGDMASVDRVSRPDLTLVRPNVSVIGTIQPGILTDSLKGSHFASGFAARLLLAYPPEYDDVWRKADVTRDVREAYAEAVLRLYALPYPGEPHIIELSPEAEATWEPWYNGNAKRMRATGDNAPLKALYAKMPLVSAKLALILQVAESAVEDDPAGVGFATSANLPDGCAVSADVMRRAIELAEWFAAEYERLIDELDLSQASDDEALCELLPETFGAKDVAVLQRVTPRQGLNIIKRLIRKGFARKIKSGSYETLHAKRK